MTQLSRRSFLRGSAVTATAVSFNSLFGVGKLFAQSQADDPQFILNVADTAETFACVHYYTALQNADSLGLTDQEQSWLRAFLDSELKHKQFLEANGATALASEFYVPEGLFTDRSLFVETTNTAENWFIAAYMAATRRFAELGNSLLAATAAQVAGVESEHQALIRLMGGMQPSFQTLKEPLFFNGSEVVPLFQPFLEGGDGFVGPAAFPGETAILDAVGDMGVTTVTPFISLNNAGTLMTNAQATPNASGDACTVTGRNTRIRAGAGTTFEQTGTLASGTTAPVVGQTTDASGFTWYQIDQGWVRADVVAVSGNCSAVPMTGM